MHKMVLNPYEYLSEKQLLVAGLLFMLFGSLLAASFNARFDGAIDLHFVPSVMYWQPLLDNIINVFSTTIPLYIAGLFINGKTRFIDMLNTVLIARVPYYVVPLLNVQNVVQRGSGQLLEHALNGTPIGAAAIIMNIVFAICAICALVAVIWLLYQGFKTATNCKTVWHKLIFAGCIFLAEILSKIGFAYLTI